MIKTISTEAKKNTPAVIWLIRIFVQTIYKERENGYALLKEISNTIGNFGHSRWIKVQSREKTNRLTDNIKMLSNSPILHRW